MKLTCCENGHFYNGAEYDDCPFCGSHRVSPVTDPNFLRSCAEFYSDEITLEPVFARCENGHTYNRELYARCPVCEKNEQEKKENREAGKEKPPMKLMRCEKGHFYNGAAYDSCPYCSEEALKENRPPDEKQQNGQKENLSDKSEPSVKKAKLIANITYCENGHFYDGELYDTCPYCSSAPEVYRLGVPYGDEEKFSVSAVMCENGHIYNRRLYTTCPYCRDAAQDDDDEKTII